MEQIILEKEIDIPENWTSNNILIRNKENNIIEINVPDDKEG